MIQEKNRMDLVYSFDYLIDGDELWIVSYWHSLLCCYSLTDERIKLLEPVPGAGGIEYAYSSIVKYKNIILLIPANANNVAVYYTESNRFDFIDLEKKISSGDKFWNYKLRDNYIYIFGSAQSTMLKLDMQTREQIYMSEWGNDVKADSSRTYFQASNYEEKSKVYMLSNTSNKMVIYDTDTDNYSIVEIGEKDDIYSTIASVENNTFLLTTENGDCVVANISNGKSVKIYNQIPGFESHRYNANGVCFMDSVRVEDDVYLFPAQANMVIKYSIGGQKIKRVSWFDEQIDGKEYEGTLFSKVKQQDGKIYGFEAERCRFWELDPKEGSVKYSVIDLELLGNDKRVELLSKICVDKAVHETKRFSLDEFVSAIMKI